MTTPRYSLVFAFTPDREGVILIKKARKPAAHIGLLNGLGGKLIEGKETMEQCAEREFLEESGLSEVERGIRYFRGASSCPEGPYGYSDGCLSVPVASACVGKFELFATLRGPCFEAACFRVFQPVTAGHLRRNSPEGEVGLWPVRQILEGNCRTVPNVPWLVALALADGENFRRRTVEVTYV